jgi:hypothetical protein
VDYKIVQNEERVEGKAGKAKGISGCAKEGANTHTRSQKFPAPASLLDHPALGKCVICSHHREDQEEFFEFFRAIWRATLKNELAI